MNENLNLCEILKDCPKGTELWTSILGYVSLEEINETDEPIVLSFGSIYIKLYPNGKLLDLEDAECIVFPSKGQRDWSKFKVPVKKFDPKEFKPYDKILIRDGKDIVWILSLFESLFKKTDGGYLAVDLCRRYRWNMCIPFNSETEHLLGTTDDCPEFYKWWEE